MGDRRRWFIGEQGEQMKALLRSTVLLTVAQLTQRVGTVVLTLVISRWLGAAELGVYAGAMATYSLLVLACGLGAKSYLVREIAKFPAQTARYLLHFGGLGLGLGVVVMGVGWMSVPIWGLSAEQATAVHITLLGLPAAILNVILYATFIAHQRVSFITYVQFVLTLVQVALSGVLLWMGGDVSVVLVAMISAEWITLLLGLFFLQRYITPLRGRLSWSFLREMLGEIKTFALLSLLSGLFAQPEVLLLTFMVDETATGYFSAAYKLITLWLIVPEVVMTNVFPLMARAYHSDNASPAKLQALSVKYLLLICLPLGVGMIAAARPIIALFFGDGYELSARLLQIMALSVPLNTLINIFWRILAARHEQHRDLQVRLVAVPLRLAMGVLLIRGWGIDGAAVAALLGLLLTAILLGRHVLRDGTRLHLWRGNWRTGLAAVGMGAVVWSVVGIIPLVPLVMIGGALYLGLVLVMGGISADDVGLFEKR